MPITPPGPHIVPTASCTWVNGETTEAPVEAIPEPVRQRLERRLAGLELAEAEAHARVQRPSPGVEQWLRRLGYLD